MILITAFLTLVVILIGYTGYKYYLRQPKKATEQKLTDFEKEYPVSDMHGNHFKTMPKVYTKKYLTKGMSSYYNFTGLTTSFSPIQVEGKPTGFIEVEEHSYEPFYEDTAKVYDKVDYIYTKNIPKWEIKKDEWVKFEPMKWGDGFAPITKVTTFSYTRLVPLMTAGISFDNAHIYNGTFVPIKTATKYQKINIK